MTGDVIFRRKNKTVYRKGDLCYKVFHEDFSKADALNEALNQARVEETNLKIPKIKEIVPVDGKWAVVSEFIEGETLEQKLKNHPEKKDEYMEWFVDLQLAMHNEKCPRLNKIKDKMTRKIKETTFSATIKYDLNTRLNSMPNHNKLCHGDFNMSNIIISNDGEPYYIDWAHATQGNASADAARTYLLFRLAGDVAGAKQYLKLFCQKSDTAVQYVQKWMAIVAASQSVKGNAQERELLKSWVDVVDYE